MHYHGRPRADLRHGRSKQKRHDCPLVTLGLTLDAAGFPCRSEILPGNVSEPATLAPAVTRLGRLLGDGPRPTVIMDAGLSTEETLAWLQAHGYEWITVRRGGEDPPEEDPALEFRTRQGTAARPWRVRTADGESELCLWSQQRQAKDDAILAQHRERFEGELQALHAGLAKKGCTKRYEKVVERLGRLKERYKRVSGSCAAAHDPDTTSSDVSWQVPKNTGQPIRRRPSPKHEETHHAPIYRFREQRRHDEHRNGKSTAPEQRQAARTSHTPVLEGPAPGANNRTRANGRTAERTFFGIWPRLAHGSQE